MKKILVVFFFSCLVFFSSCKDEKIPLGNEIKNDFLVDSVINHDLVFEESKMVTITGEAEPLVTIVVKILYNDHVVDYAYSTCDSLGKFSVQIIGLKGTSKYYKIEISDGHDKYKHVYDNIRFGKVFMYLGDDILFDDDIPLYANDNITYGTIQNNKIEKINTIPSKMIAAYAQSLEAKYHMPIFFITNVFKNSLIESYIDAEKLNNHHILLNYLDLTNREFDKGFLEHLEGYSVSKIIFNQGIEELSYMNDDNYLRVCSGYTMFLMTVLSMIFEKFNSPEIYIMQAPSLNNKYVSQFRISQSSAANYFDYTTLIPTFDLNNYNIVSDDLVLKTSISLTRLVNRIYNMTILGNKASHYANLIKEYEGDTLKYIYIEFSKGLNLNKVEIIENLKFTDLDGNEILADYEIAKNRLIINNFKIKNDFIAGDEALVEFLDIRIISFGITPVLVETNFYNQYLLPIIPFQIII